MKPLRLSYVISRVLREQMEQRKMYSVDITTKRSRYVHNTCNCFISKEEKKNTRSCLGL